MSSPRIVVIVNPNAQNGALGRLWADVGAVIRREVDSFEEMRTRGPQDATRITREVLTAGADVVVAIGGDGTINEVANGFFDGDRPIRPSAALAIIPFGTGGDFRKSMHIPKDIAKAARIIAAGKRRKIDVGHIDLDDGDGGTVERIFVNIASFGASGLVVKYANESSKRLGGRLTFMLATVKATLNYTNQRVRLVFDEGESVDATINTVAIANGRYFGGGMKIAPNAEVDDGLFDVVALGDVSTADTIASAHRIYSGSHLNHPKVSHRHARIVRAEPLEAQVIRMDVDGESAGILPATFRILPSALPVIVP